MHDVFISYSSHNKWIADAICNRVESGGIKCWYAPRDVAGGEEWPDAIVRAIRNSRVFVLIYSKDSNQSKQILREVSTAVDSECVIIPFRLDQSEMSNNLAYYLNAVHWLEAITPPMEANVDHLYERIRSIVGKAPESVPFADVKPPAPPVISDEVKRRQRRKKRRRWLAFFACVLLLCAALLIGIVAGGGKEKKTVQTIPLFDISNLGDYRYPFYGTSMFSRDLDKYIVQNMETGELAFAKTDTGFRFMDDLVYPIEDPHFMTVSGLGDYDVIYFIEMDTYTVKLFDTVSGKWINEKGFRLDLSDTEYLEAGLGHIDYMTPGEDHRNEFVLLVYDQKEDVQCITRAITVYPDGTQTEADISALGLTKFLAGIDKPGDHAVMMLDRYNNVKVFDVTKMETLNIPIQTLLEDYMPYKIAERSVMSENGRYFCAEQATGRSVNVVIWDILQKKQVFHETFTKNYDVYFLNDHEIVFYNEEDFSIHICDLETGRTIQKFGEAFFRENESFLSTPFVFTYSEMLDAFLFASSVPSQDNEHQITKLVLTDTEGNILAESKELEVPYDAMTAEVRVGDDMLWYFVSVQNPLEGFEDSIITICYRAQYYYDSNGQLLFK